MRTAAARMTTIALVGLLGLAVPAVASEGGREIRAAASARSVKKALRKARPGDVVVIAPGSFVGKIAIKRPGVTVRAEGVVLRPRKPGKRALVVRGDGIAVSGLEIRGGRVAVDADRVTLHGVAVGEVTKRNAVDVHGDDARLEDCRFSSVELTGRSVAVVAITGDRAVLAGNEGEQVVDVEGVAAAIPQRAFLRIAGNDALVQRNRLDVGLGIRGISVVGDDAIVSDNNLRWTSTGIVVSGRGAGVHRNALDDGQGVALDVRGDGATISNNLARGRTGDGLRVRGNAFRMTDNIVAMGQFMTTPPPVVAEAIAIPPGTPGVAVNTGGYDPPVLVGGAVGCPAVVIDGDDGTTSDNHLEYAFGNAISARTSHSTISDNALVPTSRQSGTAILIERGNANVVHSNRVTPTDFAGMVAIVVSGTQNEIRENVVDADYFFSLRGITVTGTDNAIEDNELPGVHAGAVIASGGGNVVRRNVVLDPKVGLTPSPTLAVGPLISVSDDDNLIEDNEIVLEQGDAWAVGPLTAVFVRGARNRVRANLVEGLATAGFTVVTSVNVTGDENEVEDNEVIDYGDRALVVIGDHNLVDGNVAENSDSRADNRQGRFPRAGAFLIMGSHNEVCINESAGSWDSGFVVSGSQCEIRENVAHAAGGDGFDVAGDEHAVCDNDSVDAAASGFVVSDGSDVLVDQCVAIGSGACGIASDVIGAKIIDSTFKGSGAHDIHVTGTLETFENNVFDTLLQ